MASGIQPNRPLSTEGWNGLPSDLLVEISGFLSRQDIPAVARVSRTWADVIRSRPRAVWYPHMQKAGALDFDRTVNPKRALQLYQTGNIIGQAAWARIGAVGPIPQLSAEVANRLEAPCPFWPERRLIDTHLFIWIPESVTKTVNGRAETLPVTLRNLPNLIPGAVYADTDDTAMDQHGDTPVRQGKWLLMPKELIPGSRNQTFAQQQAFVTAHGREMPHAVEMAVALFMKQFLSPDTYLLGRNPWSYTRCIETVQIPGWERRYHLVIGGFGASGLEVHYYRLGNERPGVLGSAEVQALGSSIL